MPSFVREFEHILNETRQASMTDSMMDAILSFIVWMWSVFKRFVTWIVTARRIRRKVEPELPLFDKHVIKKDGKLDPLVSVEVMRYE